MLEKGSSLMICLLIMISAFAAAGGAPSPDPNMAPEDHGPLDPMENTITARLDYGIPKIDDGPFGKEVVLSGAPMDKRHSSRRLPLDVRHFELEIGSGIKEVRLSEVLKGSIRTPHTISFNPLAVPIGQTDQGRGTGQRRDPEEHMEWSVHTGMEEGRRYAVLTVRIHPVLIKDGTLEYIHSGTLEIDHTLPVSSAASSIFLNGTYDMLVICPGEFRTRIEKYADYRNETGIRTIPVSLEEIWSGDHWEVHGADAQEKIKSFILNATLEWDIEYVMLAGDVDRIPARHILVLDGNDDSGAAKRDGAFVPADLYYSDLFQGGTLDLSTWNSYTDGDHQYLWGEYDGSMLDSPDLYPDVHVGRIPASTLDELDLMLDKISVYELGAKGSDWVRNATLGGTDIYTGDDVFEGELLCDHVASSYLDGYNVSRFYESQGDLVNITHKLENHTGFALLSNHGDYSGWGYTSNHSGVMRLSTASGMKNAGELPIIIMDACLTHGFDNENASDENKGKDPIYNQWYYPPGSVHRGRDSLGEWLHLAERGGAVATFGSTRVSYGSPGATYPNALSGYMASHLTMAMSGGEGTPGRMLSTAISDYMNENGASTHEDYKTVTQFVLLGDPSLNIGGIDPVSLNITLENDRVQILPGEKMNFTFDIENSGSINASLDLGVEVIDNGAVFWTSNISFNTTRLGPGENVSGEIELYAPHNARAFQTRTVRLTVNSLLLPEPVTVDLVGEADRTQGVKVDMTPEEFKAEQGTDINGYFHIRNTGNGEEVLLLDLTGVPPEWSWYIDETEVDFNPFGTVDVPFMLSIPDPCRAGRYDMDLRVRSNVTGVDLNTSFIVDVEAERSMRLELPDGPINLSDDTPLRIPVTLDNLGNAPVKASLEWTLFGSEEWDIRFSQEEIEVPAFSSISVDLLVQGPAGVPPGSYIISISATNGSASYMGDLEITVREKYLFDARIGTDRLIVNTKSTVSTSLNISNHGNIYDQYLISFPKREDQNITLTSEASAISVPSGSYRSVEVEVDVDEPLNGTYDLTVMISSVSGAGDLELTLNVTVRSSYNFSVTREDPPVKGLPGRRVTFSVVLVNEGNTNDTLRSTVDPPERWSHYNGTLETVVSPKSERLFEFDLLVPEDETAGLHTFRLTTFSQGMNRTKIHTLRVRVLEVYGLNIFLDMEEAPMKLRPGRLHTISLSVENAGNSMESVDLGFSASSAVRSWISLSTSELTKLMPQENRSVSVLIDVPVNVTPGSYDLSIFVSSKGDIEAYKEEVPLVIEEEEGSNIFSEIDPVPVIITVIIGLLVMIGIAVVVVRLYRKNTGVDLEEAGMEWEEDEEY